MTHSGESSTTIQRSRRNREGLLGAQGARFLARLTEKKEIRDSGLFRGVEFDELEIDLIRADLGILLDDAYIKREP